MGIAERVRYFCRAALNGSTQLREIIAELRERIAESRKLICASNERADGSVSSIEFSVESFRRLLNFIEPSDLIFSGSTGVAEGVRHRLACLLRLNACRFERIRQRFQIIL